jgi:hypothetical protein
MPYSAEISRLNPGCFLILIDQSGSMADAQASSGVQKAQGASDALNRLLADLVIRCTKQEGVRDYFDVGVIGYGQDVQPALAGALAGRDLVPISEIADLPSRVEERVRRESDGAGGLVDVPTRLPVWLEPVANGGTPMCEALNMARSALNGWIGAHQTCFPPIVINMTDGEATDGDPLSPAQELMGLKTDDGQLLLFNCHISSHKAQPVLYPDSESGLVDDYAKLLFRMSSTLPERIRAIAAQEEHVITESSRGFVFNADIADLVKFLDIGTRVSTDLR